MSLNIRSAPGHEVILWRPEGRQRARSGNGGIHADIRVLHVSSRYFFCRCMPRMLGT